MDQEIVKKLLCIQDMLLTDAKYQTLYKEYKMRDQAFKQMISRLDDDARSVMWDYLGVCTEMHLRMLELAVDTEKTIQEKAAP